MTAVTLNQRFLSSKNRRKKSDVNIAVDIVNDAWLNRYDCAVLVSNDSDLAAPLLVSKNMGKTIGLATTTHRPAVGLEKIPDFHRHITNQIVKKSQLPEQIVKPNSNPPVTYRKPDKWK